MQLSTLTDRLLPMQPIRLIVRVTVAGQASVSGALILHPPAGRCGFVVEGAGASHQVNSRDMVLNTMGLADYLPPARARTYAPGFEEVLDAVALYDPRAGEYLFPSPGRYDLQFWVQFFAGTGLDDYRPGNIKSNTVSLTVEEPEGERFASRVWRLPWGMPQEFGGDEVVTGFVDDDDTSYSKYARFAMSGWSQISVGERIRMLQVLAESAPPVQIHDLVLLRLATLLFEEGRLEECRRYAPAVIDLQTAPEHSKKHAAELDGKAARMLGQ